MYTTYCSHYYPAPLVRPANHLRKCVVMHSCNTGGVYLGVTLRYAANRQRSALALLRSPDSQAPFKPSIPVVLTGRASVRIGSRPVPRACSRREGRHPPGVLWGNPVTHYETKWKSIHEPPRAFSPVAFTMRAVSRRGVDTSRRTYVRSSVRNGAGVLLQSGNSQHHQTCDRDFIFFTHAAKHNTSV